MAKGLVDRVALKTLIPQQRLFRFRGFRKLKIFHKIFALSILVPYFFAYQPALKVPPVQRQIVEAEEVIQAIEMTKLDPPFILPHPGYISTHYSYWHKGVDIATGVGMPVHPISKGKIVNASFTFWGLGHYIVIEHEQNITSTYGHLGRIFVRVGDEVTQNSTIGEAGLTGRTTGPHTHLEITKNGEYINPENILPKLSDYPNEKLLKQQEKFIEKPVGGRQNYKLNLKKELKFTL